MTRPARPSAEYLRLAALPPRQVEALMLRGERPDVDALIDWEFRGLNLGLGPRLLGIRKFIKGFYRTPDGAAFGYNLRVRQNGPAEPWRARRHDGAPRRYAYYSARPVDAAGPDNAYLEALLLDYGAAAAGRFDVAGRLRDYLVRVESGADDLLLGKAFVALGPWRLPAGYFLLERFRRPR
jgi:hypothetical protein